MYNVISCHLCHLYLMCNLIFQHLAACVFALVAEPTFGPTTLHSASFISTDHVLIASSCSIIHRLVVTSVCAEI